jgi:hypothetical protein
MIKKIEIISIATRVFVICFMLFSSGCNRGGTELEVWGPEVKIINPATGSLFSINESIAFIAKIKVSDNIEEEYHNYHVKWVSDIDILISSKDIKLRKDNDYTYIYSPKKYERTGTSSENISTLSEGTHKITCALYLYEISTIIPLAEDSIEITIFPNPDNDGDGILNDDDNCPDDANPQQEDMDEDGRGDICDDDRDGDGFINNDDNCPDIANPDQEDTDSDGVGDACDQVNQTSFNRVTIILRTVKEVEETGKPAYDNDSAVVMGDNGHLGTWYGLTYEAFLDVDPDPRSGNVRQTGTITVTVNRSADAVISVTYHYEEIDEDPGSVYHLTEDFKSEEVTDIVIVPTSISEKSITYRVNGTETCSCVNKYQYEKIMNESFTKTMIHTGCDNNSLLEIKFYK